MFAELTKIFFQNEKKSTYLKFQHFLCSLSMLIFILTIYASSELNNTALANALDTNRSHSLIP